MCGIVGVIGKNLNGFTLDEQKTFEQLLFMDLLRGEDATGVFVVAHDGEIKGFKGALDAYQASYTQEYKDVMEFAYQSGKIAIGHNRKGTIGKKDDDNNAHPFVINNEFVFVHNGTLTAHKHLADVEVDSQALAIHLHAALAEGEDKLDEALHKVYGAYACIFYDARYNKLFVFRNSQRPLSILSLKNNDGYVIASEALMGYAAAARNGMKVEESTMIPENTLITFDFSGNKSVPKPHIRKLEEKKYTYSNFTGASAATTAHTPKQERGQVTGASNGTTLDDLSKNKFKRFREKFIGKKIEFVLEDYVESDIKGDPSPPTGNWLLFGSMQPDPAVRESYLPNYVQGLIDSKLFGQYLDHYEGMLTGVVKEMEYNKVMRRAIIKVENIQLPALKKNETTTYIQ